MDMLDHQLIFHQFFYGISSILKTFLHKNFDDDLNLKLIENIQEINNTKNIPIVSNHSCLSL